MEPEVSRVVWLALLAAPMMAQPLPEYRAGRTVDAITVDGKLDELTWQVMPRVGPFRDIRNPDRKDTAATEATVVWDDRFLYFAFGNHDAEPWSTMLEKDMHLWEQEVVEVFLDPDADGRDYPELEVSPNNVVVDLLIPQPPNGQTDPDIAARWDISGLRTAVGRHAQGWVVEIAIPWASLREIGITSAPTFGTKWRVGLYRIERPGGPANQKNSDEHQFLAWSVTDAKRGFHVPERFGVVEFVLRP